MQLQGQEQFVGLLLERSYAELMQKHHFRITDERSQTHLQVFYRCMAAVRKRPRMFDVAACMHVLTRCLPAGCLSNASHQKSASALHQGQAGVPVIALLIGSTAWFNNDLHLWTAILLSH